MTMTRCFITLPPAEPSPYSIAERSFRWLSRSFPELSQLDGTVDVHITHIKPGETEAVMAEIGRLGTPPRIHAPAAGQVTRVG